MGSKEQPIPLGRLSGLGPNENRWTRICLWWCGVVWCIVFEARSFPLFLFFFASIALTLRALGWVGLPPPSFLVWSRKLVRQPGVDG